MVLLVDLLTTERSKMKSVLVLVSLLAVGQAILLEVPGYATVRGIEGTSHHTGRPFHKFRGLFYGEKPNSLTRFLVIAGSSAANMVQR